MKKIVCIFFILLGCEKDVTIFPKYGEFGKNILYENYTQFVGSYKTDKTWYSLTTEFPIKIIIQSIEGIWYIGLDDQWEYSPFVNGEQEFISDGFADKKIFFMESGSAIIKYYENNEIFLQKQIYWEYLHN